MDTKHCVGSLLLGNVKPLHFSDYFLEKMKSVT